MDKTYKIVRFFKDTSLGRVDMANGLTLAEAQAHCRKPETSSETATDEVGVACTKAYGEWFDGYEQEW